ncbi:MAG: NUDIX hydrolase [Cognatishimia sp.]|uniref:NUDIX domain-containing protein n=1 Tax=Cognatishimia sp. TaxID=2211648 RepID=UPI003B8BBC7F
MTVFVGSQIITILRDDIPTIPMPNHWDLPGGGREDDESAWDCAARECVEETSLSLTASDLLWGRIYATGPRMNWFFVAKVDASMAKDLVLGAEGQGLRLMSVDDYLTHPMAVPHFQSRLADWVSGNI